MRAPFSRVQAAALKQLSQLWVGRPFVLVGASAIKCHIDLPRPTEDVDITLSVSLEDFPAGLGGLPGWRRSSKREHEWRGPGEVMVDVLPASDALLAKGFIEWPSGHRMNLAGMRHVFTRNHPIHVDEGLELLVADLPVLALLKVVSYLDRPAEREHDLGDLSFVAQHYGEDDDRRWSRETADLQLDYDDVGAYLLGKDLAAFATPTERACLEDFIDRARRDADGTGSKLCRLGPVSWRSEESMVGRIAALERGLIAK